jgi:hypothetical protein
LWSRFESTFEHIESVGARVVIELSDCCEYWHDRRIQFFIDGKGFQLTTFDGCMHGLRAIHGHDKGMHIRKIWRLASYRTSVGMFLNKRCDRSHSHTPAQGSNTKFVEKYTSRICELALKAFKADVRQVHNFACAIVGFEPATVKGNNSRGALCTISNSNQSDSHRGCLTSSVLGDSGCAVRSWHFEIAMLDALRQGASAPSEEDTGMLPRYAHGAIVVKCPFALMVSKHCPVTASWLTQCVIAHGQAGQMIALSRKRPLIGRRHGPGHGSVPSLC